VCSSDLKNAIHPPLTATRTTGALGGIIASRVAKEFRLGGPCFIVSCEEASGLKALEIGVRSIRNGETDHYLVGAVDLPGEIRNLVVSGRIKDQIPSPCEGAAAIVLKSLDKAIQDNDRIYAVINGIGKACQGGIDELHVSEDACVQSLERVFEDAAVSPGSVAYVETHGSESAMEAQIELSALNRFFSEQLSRKAGIDTIAIGSAAHNTGYTGSVQGLASLIKSCLCLYQGVIPAGTKNSGFADKIIPTHFSAPSATYAPTHGGPYRALVSSITSDGNVCHVVLESAGNAGNLDKTGLRRLEPRITSHAAQSGHAICVTVGGKILKAPELPPDFPIIIMQQTPVIPSVIQPAYPIDDLNVGTTAHDSAPQVSEESEALALMNQVIRNYALTNARTAQAHTAFLDFSQVMAKTFAETLKFQTDLMLQVDGTVDPEQLSSLFTSLPVPVETPQPVAAAINAEIIPEPQVILPKPGPEPAFPREMCMEFAIGSIGKVLGPMFDIVDTYKVRVRLPDEPLMLVDRIMSVEGEKGSLKSGKVVTEHDVFPGAWYLDGGRCPVCISIEAGQADLFLCSYLGIDLAVKGKRSYRLLDAVAKFHGGLPKAGDTIRYEIEIDRFINQGETYLFFFHFNGFIGDRHIISMRKGCAGFFTDKEVKDSGGIILTAEETAKKIGRASCRERVS
jgi:hypothetical protein